MLKNTSEITFDWNEKKIRQYNNFYQASKHAKILRKIKIPAYVKSDIIDNNFDVTILFPKWPFTKIEFKQMDFLWSMFEDKVKYNEN